MRRFAIIMIAALLMLTAGTAEFAKAAGTTEKGTTEADASLVIGSGPDGFDAAVGFAIGAGTIISPNVQIRGDLTFITFSRDLPFFGTLDYTRIPLTISGRYYLPTSQDVKVFVQGGIEMSFDHLDFFPFPGAPEATHSDVHFGITPGAGVQIGIAPQLDFVADVRYHIIEDDYATFQAGVAFKF